MTFSIKKLTVANFFKKYIIHPRRENLSPKDRRIATVSSVAIGIASFGLLHLAVAIARSGRKLFKLLTEDDVESNEVEAAQAVAKQIFNEKEPERAAPPPSAPEAVDAPAPPSAPPAEKPETPPEPPKKKPREVLDDLAKEFALKAKAHEGRFAIKGIPNLGNTCYMNAALQNIESLILSQPAGDALLKEDLSFKQDETYEGIEKRLLHSFAPIAEPQIPEYVQRPESMKDDAKYEEFKAKTLQARREMAMPEYTLALEIKWSLLVLLQVKNFGTKEQLLEAIEAHRDHFFDKIKGSDFTAINRMIQLDSGDYMRLIINKLGLNLFVNVKQRENEKITRKEALCEFLVMNPLFNPEVQENFSDLLEKTFMVEEINGGARRRLRLDGEPPPNLVIRIERNYTAPLERVYLTTEMQLQDGILKPVIVPKPLPKWNGFEMKNCAELNFAGVNIDALNLGQFYRKKREAHYKIVAINVHIGESQKGGHYISYIRVGDDWYLMNDDVASKVSKENVPFGHASMITLARVLPENIPVPAAPAKKDPESPEPAKEG